MRVVATKKGFYNRMRVYPGEEFYVPDGVTGSWFVPVEMAPAPKPKAKAKEPQTLSEMASDTPKVSGPSHFKT